MAGKPAYQTTVGEAVDGIDRVCNKIKDDEYLLIGCLKNLMRLHDVH